MRLVQAYVEAKIKQFAGYFTAHVPGGAMHVEHMVQAAISAMSLHDQSLNAGRDLRLVLRHDCQ